MDLSRLIPFSFLGGAEIANGFILVDPDSTPLQRGLSLVGLGFGGVGLVLPEGAALPIAPVAGVRAAAAEGASTVVIVSNQTAATEVLQAFAKPIYVGAEGAFAAESALAFAPGPAAARALSVTSNEASILARITGADLVGQARPLGLPGPTIEGMIVYRYRRYYTEAWETVVQQFNEGRIRIHPDLHWQTVLGQRVEGIARRDLLNFLRSLTIIFWFTISTARLAWRRDGVFSGSSTILRCGHLQRPALPIRESRP